MASPPRPPRRVSLAFDLGGRKFPLPIVSGVVGGVKTTLLVDTGANSHVIAGWLARKAGLPLQKLGDLGTDHAGRAIATYRVDDPRIHVDGWGDLGGGPALAADVPEAIERMGIGGFVSPQKLAAAGEVIVLDLARAEMHTSAEPNAARELTGRGKSITTRGVRACIDNASAIHGLAYVVHALIDGVSADLLLDTGAHRTDLLAPSRVGRGLTGRSVVSKDSMYAASGKITTRTVPNAQVRLGEFTMVTDVDIVPGQVDDVCPRDGVVSMDVLKNCILVLGKNDALGRCAPPAETPRSLSW